MNPHTLAERRVDRHPKLVPYRDLLIEYNWPEGDEHWCWVATAPLAEILDWCAGIRQNEQEEEDRIQYHEQLRDERMLAHGG